MKSVNAILQPSRTIVMKFGGTSVGNASAIRNAADIVATHTAHWDNVAVVLSAMRGITEKLLACTEAAASGNRSEIDNHVEFIREKNLSVIRDLFLPGAARIALEVSLFRSLNELYGYCDAILARGEAPPNLIDAVSSFGERLNARLFSAQLREIGLSSRAVNSTGLIMTNSNFMNASPLPGPTRKLAHRGLKPLFAEGIVPVVTGFIGASSAGHITTLGRGGSDYTATILGASLDAEEVWIWSDVAGVMTADPRLVPEAAVVANVGYAEIHELANFGGRVLHPKTILPVRAQNIPVRVRHTFDPDYSGTLIGHPYICNGRDDLMVTLLSNCQLNAENQVILNGDQKSVVPVHIDRPAVSMDRRVSIVSVVGKAACSGDLKHGAFRKLAQHHVDVYGTGQTEVQNRFSLVVPEARAHEALRSIHNEVVYL
jgi:aspartate kinase